MKKEISRDDSGWITTIECFKKPHGYPAIGGISIEQRNTNSGDCNRILLNKKEAKKLITFLNNCYKKPAKD